MHGNVYEWCSDWYSTDYYKRSAVDEPRGVGGHRVIRGGSWNLMPRSCRSASRYGYTPKSRYIDLGFRLALAQSGG
jgi:sulfatase modifying factor 1